MQYSKSLDKRYFTRRCNNARYKSAPIFAKTLLTFKIFLKCFDVYNNKNRLNSQIYVTVLKLHVG
ncbi:MAG: hypothetical protein LBI78_02470 [Campylobacteraceae bacterium]|nr:hypothetical protein [Campylobacteraceae bacterium]